MKHEKYRTKEYDAHSSSSREKKTGQCSFQRSNGAENIDYEHKGYKRWLSHYQEVNGKTSVWNAKKDRQVRDRPTTNPLKTIKVRYHNRNNTNSTLWKMKRASEREMENNRFRWRDRTPPRREMLENRPMRRDASCHKREMERRRPAERDRTPPKKEMKGNWQDETSGSWFKVTVPYGRKYDKSWLVNAIQSHCSVPFTPVDFHYVQMQAQFFVQDVHTASALRSISYKIHDEKNHKIAILVSHSVVPHSVQNKLTPQQMENLKLTMKKRYDVLEQALDLQNFRFDPDLVDNKIDMILNRRNCMAAALEVIEQQFSKLLRLNLSSNKLFQLDGLSDITWKAPNVKILNLSKNKLKSTWELNKIKELKLEELWLQGNPLCDSFSDHPSYVSAIRKWFPKLLKLDGHQLLPEVETEVPDTKKPCEDGHQLFSEVETEVPDTKKPCEESSVRYEAPKNLILKFLHQYYCIYDSGNRQDLLNAYHDAACFSLTIPFNPEDPASSNLIKYSIKNRNMKKHEDPVLLVQLLKHTRLDIVNTLSVLPKTQHDFASFVVDVCVQTETILYFSVKGLFKEVEEMSETPVRAFTRTFIMIPTSNSSLCIVNDQLFVRDISPEETVLLPNSPFSCMPTTPLGQQKMVQMFSLQSGMNLEWSQKCLEDNEWNYRKAAEIFTILKVKSENQVYKR